MAFRKEYKLSFLSDPNRVFKFQIPPIMDKEKYLDWLKIVEAEKFKQWKRIGIFDLIQLSRLNLSYNSPMLLSAFFFLGTFNQFVSCSLWYDFPTLFDIAAITDLRPTGLSVLSFAPNLSKFLSILLI